MINTSILVILFFVIIISASVFDIESYAYLIVVDLLLTLANWVVFFIKVRLWIRRVLTVQSYHQSTLDLYYNVTFLGKLGSSLLGSKYSPESIIYQLVLKKKNFFGDAKINRNQLFDSSQCFSDEDEEEDRNMSYLKEPLLNDQREQFRERSLSAIISDTNLLK